MNLKKFSDAVERRMDAKHLAQGTVSEWRSTHEGKQGVIRDASGKEIFVHYTQAPEGLEVGDEVSYTVNDLGVDKKTKKPRLVATNVKKLAHLAAGKSQYFDRLWFAVHGARENKGMLANGRGILQTILEEEGAEVAKASFQKVFSDSRVSQFKDEFVSGLRSSTRSALGL
jgi:cold shock CspA family protein